MPSANPINAHLIPGRTYRLEGNSPAAQFQYKFIEKVQEPPSNPVGPPEYYWRFRRSDNRDEYIPEPFSQILSAFKLAGGSRKTRRQRRSTRKHKTLRNH